MDKCPSCGGDSLFVQFGPWIDFEGQAHYGGRVAAWCNNMECDQRFWWHPTSGRVTRRNTGQTYTQYRANRLSTCARPHFDEIKATVTVGEADPERLTINESREMMGLDPLPGSQSGWRETALGWAYWLRGSFRLLLPGGKEKGS